MTTQRYSYLLVSLQFIFIAILLFHHGMHFPKPLPFFIIVLGCGVGIYAIVHNQLGNFNITPEIKHNSTLITTGAYRYIRHPMYFSVLLMMLGIVVSKFGVFSIFIYCLLVLTLLMKAKKEEALWMAHSSEYQQYMQKTKRMIPFIL